MRALGLVLAVLILLLQYPLWLGKGSWLKVWELERRIEEQRMANRALAQRNAKLAAEVEDLKQGYDAIEERARFELGMIKRNEIFFQVVEGEATAMAGTRAAQTGPARSLSDWSDRSEPSGRARTDFHDFEAHSEAYVTRNRGNRDRYPTGAVDRSQVRQAPRSQGRSP